MPDMLKIGDKKETVKIQTPGQPNGLDLQIGSPPRAGMGKLRQRT
jgi:hypothetical protein